MIPISCPNCGRKGTIPNDRLNTRMHCKKCDAVFHMDKSGKIMLGEPGQVRGKTPKGAPPPKGKGARRSKDEPAFTSFAEIITKAPPAAKLGVFGLLVLALFWMTIGRNIKMPAGAPKTLDGRIDRVFRAFAVGNPDDVKPMSTPESRDKAKEWFDLVRPRFKYDGRQERGKECFLQVYKPQTEENAPEADAVLLIFEPPRAEPLPEVEALKKAGKPKDPMVAGYDTNGAFSVPTHWIKKGNEWQLDITKTIEGTKAKDAAPAK